MRDKKPECEIVIEEAGKTHTHIEITIMAFGA